VRRASVLALSVVSIVALAFGVAQAGTGSAQKSGGATAGVRGNFNFLAMMHTSTAQFPTLPDVNPWDGKTMGTRFAYRSIPCTGNAPVNNISSNLPSYGSRVAGSRVPSSTRLHPFAFNAVQKNGRREIQGSFTITVCKLAGGPTPNPDPVPDESKPKIRVKFRAPYRRDTAESLSFQGTFRIVGGTQRYEDLTGTGTIAGYLFCFAENNCSGSGGKYLDGQVSLQGTYADPTPDLAAG